MAACQKGGGSILRRTDTVRNAVACRRDAAGPNSVVGYRNPAFQLQEGEDLPLSDVTEIALTMPLTDRSYAAARIRAFWNAPA